MFNPNGESGSTGDSGMTGSLETRTGERPKLLARLLTARGLIELAPHPSDKRRVQAGVTPAGRDALEQARKTTWLTARIAELDEDDRDTLAGAVQVLDSLSR